MKRTENLTIDLKVKDYNVVRLKQLDTTEFNIKILDNSNIVDLSNLTAYVIFTKPNKTIVIQDATVDTENNLVNVELLEDCLRQNGKAKMEIELREDDEIFSSFYIELFIEHTSKENVESDDAEVYIETLEQIITNLKTEADELLAQLEQAGDDEISSIETRYTNLTDTINTFVSEYEELKQYVEDINNNVESVVSEKMKTLKETTTIASGTTITNGYEVTLPLNYQVRQQFTRVKTR